MCLNLLKFTTSSFGAGATSGENSEQQEEHKGTHAVCLWRPSQDTAWCWQGVRLCFRAYAPTHIQVYCETSWDYSCWRRPHKHLPELSKQPVWQLQVNIRLKTDDTLNRNDKMRQGVRWPPPDGEDSGLGASLGDGQPQPSHSWADFFAR